tara:strand:+ start:5203 stop:6648 length:1446 start_codon:yes stop_codon:yes gene_type:complete
MIKFSNIKDQRISADKLTEILFYTFPLSFIIGNLFLNLHVLLFIIISLYLIKTKQLLFRFKSSNWILISFFLYLFLSTLIQFQSPGLLNEGIKGWSLENQPIFKSFILFRFVILVFIIDTLFLNNVLKLKNLLLFSLLCTSFVSYDILQQYIVGFDLFGFKSQGIRNSGPFGDEMIAGGYLQKFSFFSFFYIFTTFHKKKFNSLLLIFIIALHLTAILLAGNRMPMVLAFFGCVLIILFIKNLRFITFLGLLIFLAVFLIITKNDTNLKTSYMSFVNEVNISNLFNFKNKIDKNEGVTATAVNKEGSKTERSEGIWNKTWDGIVLLNKSGYNRIYRTSIEMWKENPIFGFGLKSFRIKCHDILGKNTHLLKVDEPESQISKFSCSNHPHNYYFELLSETGIVGAILMLMFFIILLKNSYYFLKKYNQQANSNIVLVIPIVIVIVNEIWPLRSSGSFFTTWNATFFWLSAGILLAYNKSKKL